MGKTMFDEIDEFVIYTEIAKGGFTCTYSLVSPSITVAKCYFKTDGIMDKLVIHKVSKEHINKFIKSYKIKQPYILER